MFNLGISEMAAIAVLALILIGPKQLPEVARILGRLLNDLRRSTNVFTEEMKSQVQLDRQKIFDMTATEEKQKTPGQTVPHQATTSQTASADDKPTDEKKS